MIYVGLGGESGIGLTGFFNFFNLFSFYRLGGFAFGFAGSRGLLRGRLDLGFIGGRRVYFDGLAAQLENCFLGAELLEGVKSGLDDVGGIAGAKRFREEVFDARGFDNGADATTGNKPGTR